MEEERTHLNTYLVIQQWNDPVLVSVWQGSRSCWRVEALKRIVASLTGTCLRLEQWLFASTSLGTRVACGKELEDHPRFEELPLPQSLGHILLLAPPGHHYKRQNHRNHRHKHAQHPVSTSSHSRADHDRQTRYLSESLAAGGYPKSRNTRLSIYGASLAANFIFGMIIYFGAFCFYFLDHRLPSRHHLCHFIYIEMPVTSSSRRSSPLLRQSSSPPRSQVMPILLRLSPPSLGIAHRGILMLSILFLF